MLIIGCGGIGSYLIRELSQLMLNGVKGTDSLNITIADADEVEEKNVKYQNFPEPEDLGKLKAEVLAERYFVTPITKFITTDEQLKDYDMIILAVDNYKVRELVYNYCENKDKVEFIDLRCKGRQFCFFTKNKENTLKYLLSTLDKSVESDSCQVKFELENGVIQLGNRIIANIGAQLILNYLRGDKNIAKYIQRI